MTNNTSTVLNSPADDMSMYAAMMSRYHRLQDMAIHKRQQGNQDEPEAKVHQRTEPVE